MSTEFKIDANAIAFSYAADEALSIAKKWLRANRLSGFDVIFNSEGSETLAIGGNLITAVGRYVLNRKPSGVAVLPPGAPATHIVDIPSLVKSYPGKLASCLCDILEAHRLQPFAVRSRPSALKDAALTIKPPMISVVDVRAPPTVRVNPASQLFNPRKSYILVGGSSELGVRITWWMVNHGARHIILTSRRGEKALTKVDSLYINYLRINGVRVDVVAANAVSKRDMSVLVEEAKKSGPIGGVFLMTVVLRDAAFTNLTQEVSVHSNDTRLCLIT